MARKISTKKLVYDEMKLIINLFIPRIFSLTDMVKTLVTEFFDGTEKALVTNKNCCRDCSRQQNRLTASTRICFFDGYENFLVNKILFVKCYEHDLVNKIFRPGLQLSLLVFRSNGYEKMLCNKRLMVTRRSSTRSLMDFTLPTFFCFLLVPRTFSL